jgi:hypothetical protein
MIRVQSNAALRALLALFCAALLAPAVAEAVPSQDSSAGATLVYRKVFKNSSPEFVELHITDSGRATADIRTLEDDPAPMEFEVSQTLTQQLFALAGELNYFNGIELDVRRRIANLGEKTFRYERGATAYQVVFNYSLNPAAGRLLQLFEGLARQMEHRERLERRLRFDRLGIHQALLSLESDLNRGVLPEPAVLAPLLETIAADTRILEMARQRARSLLERIRPSA